MHGAKHASSHLSLVIRNGFTVFIIKNTATTISRPFNPFFEVVFVVTYQGFPFQLGVSPCYNTQYNKCAY